MRLDPGEEVAETVGPEEREPVGLGLSERRRLVDAGEDRGGHDLVAPKTSSHLTALTAASLFTRLYELVLEFDTLHSSGMRRRSQRPMTRSAFRPPKSTSWQNSPGPGASSSVRIVDGGGTRRNPAAMSADATAPSWSSFASLRRSVRVRSVARSAAVACTAACRSASVGLPLLGDPGEAPAVEAEQHGVDDPRRRVGVLAQARAGQGGAREHGRSSSEMNGPAQKRRASSSGASVTTSTARSLQLRAGPRSAR